MILIGQYDSPFVRRVAIALTLYGHSYQHWPWSSFRDADKLAAYNPLFRVPTLVLDGGEVLIESAAMLDYLDEIAAPGDRMTPAQGSLRRSALKVCALATGLCDKMVALVYERILHAEVSPAFVARCEGQICGVLDALEQDRSLRSDRAFRDPLFWFGDRIGHADIAVACAMRFLEEAHPAIHARGQWPILGSHAALCEGMDAFRAAGQKFTPPQRPAG